MTGGMFKRGSRWAAAAVTVAATLFGFAGMAHAGKLTPSSVCGPDGSTIVTLTATNTAPVEIDGVLVIDHTVVTGPGTHVAVWWKPGTTERIPENIWGTYTIVVPALTNCVSAPAPTPTEVPSSSTTASALPPAPVPSSTILLDLDTTACQTEVCTGQPPVASTLPATATGITEPATVIAFGLLVAGFLACWAARRRRTEPEAVVEPPSNVVRVHPSAGPFDWDVDA